MNEEPQTAKPAVCPRVVVRACPLAVWLRARLPFPALPHFRFSRILKGREVHFSPDVETRLQELTFAHGKDAEQLVKDTFARIPEC